jgi:hypothetical protein
MRISKKVICMFKIKKGCYRRVYIFGNCAIKFPRLSFKNTLKRWCIGYLSNCSEIDIFKEAKKECEQIKDSDSEEYLYSFCPIIFNFLGLFLVMRKTEPISDCDFEKISKEREIVSDKNNNVDYRYWNSQYMWDWKIENFGKLKNKIVLIDYANDFRGNRFEQNCFWFK